MNMATKNKEQIRLDGRNVRVHDERNKLAIAQSLKELGAGRSILIDAENVVIGGNGVYQEAQELGLPVKVIESDGSELIAIKRTDLKTNDAKRKALAIADNRTNDLSVFDDAKVAEMFAELEDFADAAGFSPEEIEALGKTVEDMESAEVPDDPEKGDMPFAEELLEAHNYVVLYFDNNVDWLQAQTIFELRTVKESGSKPGYTRFGIGRVINGARALNLILGVKDKKDRKDNADGAEKAKVAE